MTHYTSTRHGRHCIYFVVCCDPIVGSLSGDEIGVVTPLEQGFKRQSLLQTSSPLKR
jgi:hypothetical protein